MFIVHGIVVIYQYQLAMSIYIGQFKGNSLTEVQYKLCIFHGNRQELKLADFDQ
jgi:hypothetical protein